MWVLRVIQALKLANVQYAIAGGYAVVLHGAVRGTVDLDLVLALSLGNLERAEVELKKLGLQSRIPVTAKEISQFRQEYISKRNLIAWSFVDPKDPSHVVDLIITHDLGDLTTVSKVVGGTKLTVLSLSSLIDMKKQAGRPQDMEDIKALEALHGKKKG